MGFSFRKILMGENAIAKMEDLNNRRDICFYCEFKTGKSKKYFRYTSCNCYIDTKIISHLPNVRNENGKHWIINFV